MNPREILIRLKHIGYLSGLENKGLDKETARAGFDESGIDQALSAVQDHCKAKRLSEGEIFNILTKQLPYDITTTRFSIRKKVAHAIFTAQQKKDV